MRVASKSSSRGVWRLLAIGVRLFTNAWRRLSARRDLAILANMTDAELRDIGLGRHDILTAVSLPTETDPTSYLAHIVRERRAARSEQIKADRRQIAQPPGGDKRRPDRNSIADSR